MLALIRGAGDLASGIALRLYRSGIGIVMTDLERPMSIRRTVAFSDAILRGTMTVEDVTAKFAENVQQAREFLAQGTIPVLADPECRCREELKPDVLVDAILAKKNLGTKITDAPVVIGVGPGFIAGEDCHAVIETMRGHTLGRAIYRGSALPTTNIPGLIGGVLRGLIADGATVQKGLKCGDVDPRAEVSYCDTVSDKASAIGGGVLEAVLHLSDVLREQ